MVIPIKKSQSGLYSLYNRGVQATIYKKESDFFVQQSNALAHTKWMCKYHIVFKPKYRRKIIYNQYRKDLGKILRELCRYKGIEILEGHLMPDHVLGEHTTENSNIQLYGISERKVRPDDVRKTWKLKIQIWEQVLWVRRILCEYNRIK